MESIRRIALAQTSITQRHKCPECSAGRKNHYDKPLSVTLDGSKALYHCWHCDIYGVIDTRPTYPTFPEIINTPKKREPSMSFGTPDGTTSYEYLAKRGITRSVADAAGVVFDTHYINGKHQSAVGFPYKNGKGSDYAIKWRAIHEKSFTQTGAANTLWQIERIKEGDPLVICEGEMDCLAFWQAGVPAVSVPNGAPQKVSNGRSSPMEDKKYQYLWAAKQLIDRASKVVLASDNDGPGEALGEELARRIGRGKCWKISWPEGCKDANAVLVKHGSSVIKELVECVHPWPVKGLYSADHFSKQIDDLYDKGIVRGESTGYRGVDDIYTVMPGQLSIVTGIPSMGKSAWIDQVMVNLSRTKDWKFSVCSFENEPRLHIAKLAALYTHKPFFAGPTPRMTKEEATQAKSWINDHFSFLFQGDGYQSTIEDIIDRLRSAVMRYGIRGAVIDPANFVDRDRNMSETDWVSDALTKLKVFAMAHDVHVWFIAHPMKLRRGEDGKYAVPGGYDISGSSHWFNKADIGMTVHRPDMGLSTSEVHVWKSRFHWVGRVGKTVLNYDVPTGTYYEHHNPRFGDPF